MPLVAVVAVVGEEFAAHSVHGDVCACFRFAAVTVLGGATARDVLVDDLVDALSAAQPPLERIESVGLTHFPLTIAEKSGSGLGGFAPAWRSLLLCSSMTVIAPGAFASTPPARTSETRRVTILLAGL